MAKAMTETTVVLSSGNEAVGWGAIYCGCRHFFGYPITPQNEIPEFMSRELPKLGGVFVQSESETASINMVYGAAATGVRAMTSTSSPGFSLMQETLSAMAIDEIPAVVVDVSRLGPGWGSIQSGQTDYRQVTKGGGHGGYRQIVLAPASTQEIFDLMQQAFHLADKYRIVVILLSDYVLGQTSEPLELHELDCGPVPEKNWALQGSAQKGGKRSVLFSMQQFWPGGTPAYFRHMAAKYRAIQDNEVRFESYAVEDARLVLVAFGSTARAARKAVEIGREEGLKVGLIRPITLWPFPKEAIRQAASRVDKLLVVEDNDGQMVEDVELAVAGAVPVHFLGVFARHLPGPSGLIHPEAVVEEVRARYE
jgi:2-oxoglutarate ferredoxin oxidoreductase subunit alpha